jgi:hypothetical protein
MTGTTLLRSDGRPQTLMLADNRHPALAKSPRPQSRHHQGPIAINAPATSHMDIISDGTVYLHILSLLKSFLRARPLFCPVSKKKIPALFYFSQKVVMTRMLLLPSFLFFPHIPDLEGGKRGSGLLFASSTHQKLLDIGMSQRWSSMEDSVGQRWALVC